MTRWADWKGIGSYGTVGLEMVLSVMFGLFVGRWLGEKAGSATWGALIGFGFGIAAAVRALLSAFRQMQRQTANDGFRASATDRPARFEMDERHSGNRDRAPRPDDAPQQVERPRAPGGRAATAGSDAEQIPEPATDGEAAESDGPTREPASPEKAEETP